MKRTLYFILAAFFYCVPAKLAAQNVRVHSSIDQAQHVVAIHDTVTERNLMLHQLYYYEDTSNALAFAEVSSPVFDRFQRKPEYQNKDFKTNTSYWICLPIHHTTTTKKVWLLEFYDQTIDHIEAFIPQGHGGYQCVVIGDTKSFHERILPHKNFELPLTMKSDTVMYYYFKVRSHEFADIRIALRSVGRFIDYSLNEYFLFGTFYGMILIISLYNFLVFLAIREIKNVYYIMYILSVAAYAMSYDGIGFQYLWPSNPEWNNYATGFTLYSVIVWGLIFTRRFLRTHSTAPSLDRLLKWTIIVRSVVFVIEVLLFPALLTVRII